MPDVAHSKHISIDNKGRAYIAGTTCRVSQIIANHLANGWTAEEIYFQLNRSVSIAQVHAAFSYYYDNRTEIDAELAAEVAEADHLWREQPLSPFRKRILGQSSSTKLST